MTKHSEFFKKAKVSTPCASWHVTFGGRCLNCGYDPENEAAQPFKTARGAAKQAGTGQPTNTGAETPQRD